MSGETPSETGTSSSRSTGGFFPKTRWTLVQQMQDPQASQIGADALNELCQIYWKPVFVYVRSWDKSPADAEDLTQGFFSMILSKQSLDFVAPEKGKLRTFLLVAVKRFLANAHHHESALKRGGGQKPISIDAEWTVGQRKKFEPEGGDRPDALFDRQWALTVLDQALGLLRENYAADGKLPIFDALKFTISPSATKRPLAEIAADLEISEGAAKVASHRLRQRYRQTLQQVIAETVDSDTDVDGEIRYLMGAFSNR